MRAEIAAVAGDEPITAEHVAGLVFTRAVLQETMRLYPVGYTLTRVARRATTLGGIAIRAGARVLIPVYALHRHKAYWLHPDAFDPERFMPGAEPPDRYVYMPFGAGPRICAGAAFAMTEAVTVLATLVRGADLRLDPDHEVYPVAGLSLQPRGGLPMDVTAR
jgi:cytochrome P450